MMLDLQPASTADIAQHTYPPHAFVLSMSNHPGWWPPRVSTPVPLQPARYPPAGGAVLHTAVVPEPELGIIDELQRQASIEGPEGGQGGKWG
jgi:hypothetical protein